MSNQVEGVILKGIGGFYYVHTGRRQIECKAGGRLRLNRREKPAVGDRVMVEERGEEGLITQILPRKNFLQRPPIANIDQLFIVASQASPVTDPYLIDKVSVIALRQGIQPILVLNKQDVDPSQDFRQIYEKAGFPVLSTSAETGKPNVGKSSLLNRLEEGVLMETGSISRISRGRHTTRRVELFFVAEGYLADTPGFSSFDISRMEHIPKEELEQYFPEFEPFLGQCRFSGCAHCKEPDCAVDQGAREGAIAPSRLESYRKLYEEMAQWKEWENK